MTQPLIRLMPTKAIRTTTPGSTGHAIAECVRAAVATHQAPRLLAECREDYIAAHGPLPTAYAAQLYSLVRRGILVAVDGRASRTRYAHRDSILPATVPVPDQADDALTVLTALTHAAEQAGGPVTTAQVTTSLKALGVPLATTDINAVRVRLQTLARTRESGVAEWSAPRVVSMNVTTAGGRKLRCWMPANLPAAPMPDAPVFSGSDAVRGLVRHVQSFLGRPVFRRELAWWLEAHATDPVAMAMRQHMGPGKRSLSELLAFTSQADLRRASKGYELSKVGARYSCWGGLAYRYWVGPLSEGPFLADRLQEVSSALRVADELATLAKIETRATALNMPALTTLVGVRRDLLATVRDDLLHGDAAKLTTALRVLTTSYDLCGTWVKKTCADDKLYDRLDDMKTRRRHAQALAAFTHTCTQRPIVAVVGQQGSVPFSALDRFLDAAERELDIPRALARKQALRGARRTPTGKGGRYGSHAQRGDVVIDRVDALRRMFGLVSAMRTHGLLKAAADLLGPVLRDATVITALEQQSVTWPALHRAAMVAKAMLGVAPTGPATSNDVLDGRAWLLAHNLAGTTPMPSTQDLRLAVAERRIASGRLLAALG